MSLVTFVVINGLLATTVLAALAYVSRLPFRIDRSGRTLVAERIAGHVDLGPSAADLPTVQDAR